MFIRALAAIGLIEVPGQPNLHLLPLFLLSSSIHSEQNKLPQDEHYFGILTTPEQIGQSNIYP